MDYLRALVAKWRESCGRADGKPGDGKGPIAEAVRECADELAAALSSPAPSSDLRAVVSGLLMDSGGTVTDEIVTDAVARIQACAPAPEGVLSAEEFARELDDKFSVLEAGVNDPILLSRAIARNQCRQFLLDAYVAALQRPTPAPEGPHHDAGCDLVHGGTACSCAPEGPQGWQEQVICAAIMLPNGEVWRGHRHDDCIQTAGKAGATRDEIAYSVQGFVTSRNRFVNRDEAARIQREAGIVSATTGQPCQGPLFSEDVYLREWRTADRALQEDK